MRRILAKDETGQNAIDDGADPDVCAVDHVTEYRSNGQSVNPTMRKRTPCWIPALVTSVAWQPLIGPFCSVICFGEQ